MITLNKTGSTQNFVPVKEIRNGIVVLEDNSLRAVIMTSSVNLALKSQDEQMSVLLQFQNFLNSLDFSVQFYIQSKNLDIRPYIALLEEKFTEQVNDLMKIQTREYINFVKAFTEEADIMSKSFFVVVPYAAPILESVGVKGIKGLFGKKEKKNLNISEASFIETVTQLDQRVAIVEQGLSRTGVKVIKLGTEELIELFYKIFNPGDLEKPIPLHDQSQ